MTAALDEDAGAQVSQVEAGGFVLRGVLPPGWKVTKYVTNHHYVELTGPDGQIVRLNALSLVRGECTDCGQAFYVESRIGGMVCPHCQGGVEWVWGAARLSFVAETDARFSTVPPPALPAKCAPNGDET